MSMIFCFVLWLLSVDHAILIWIYMYLLNNKCTLIWRRVSNCVAVVAYVKFNLINCSSHCTKYNQLISTFLNSIDSRWLADLNTSCNSFWADLTGETSHYQYNAVWFDI